MISLGSGIAIVIEMPRALTPVSVRSPTPVNVLSFPTAGIPGTDGTSGVLTLGFDEDVPENTPPGQVILRPSS